MPKVIAFGWYCGQMYKQWELDNGRIVELYSADTGLVHGPQSAAWYAIFMPEIGGK